MGCRNTRLLSFEPYRARCAAYAFGDFHIWQFPQPTQSFLRPVDRVRSRRLDPQLVASRRDNAIVAPEFLSEFLVSHGPERGVFFANPTASGHMGSDLQTSTLQPNQCGRTTFALSDLAVAHSAKPAKLPLVPLPRRFPAWSGYAQFVAARLNRFQCSLQFLGNRCIRQVPQQRILLLAPVSANRIERRQPQFTPPIADTLLAAFQTLRDCRVRIRAKQLLHLRSPSIRRPDGCKRRPKSAAGRRAKSGARKVRHGSSKGGACMPTWTSGLRYANGC